MFRELLVDFCGPTWAIDVKPAVCCDYAQLLTLVASLTEVRQFVASCPACWLNFKVRLRDEGRARGTKARRRVSERTKEGV